MAQDRQRLIPVTRSQHANDGRPYEADARIVDRRTAACSTDNREQAVLSSVAYRLNAGVDTRSFLRVNLRRARHPARLPWQSLSPRHEAPPLQPMEQRSVVADHVLLGSAVS
jgi:hypothetical protein